MKVATKTLSGSSYSACGGPRCWRTPVAHDGDPRPHRHRLDLVVRDVHRRRRRARAAGRRSRPASRRAAARRGSRAARPSGTTCGSRTIARPIATRWRCPPESARGLRLSRSSRPSSSAVRSTRAADLRPRRPAARGAETRCCRTRSCAGRARSSGRPSRRRARRGSSALTSRSPMRISPSRDLLEPGGHPQRRRLAAARTGRRCTISSPGSISRSSPADGARPVREHLADTAQRDRGHQPFTPPGSRGSADAARRGRRARIGAIAIATPAKIRFHCATASPRTSRARPEPSGGVLPSRGRSGR